MLQQKYPETYNNILSCKHHADARYPLEYARDIVASWLIEDYFFKMFSTGGFCVVLTGADRQRKILPRVKTSTSSDFSISFQNKIRKIELMNDYQGYWSKNHALHLRDNKYKKMI